MHIHILFIISVFVEYRYVMILYGGIMVVENVSFSLLFVSLRKVVYSSLLSPTYLAS